MTHILWASSAGGTWRVDLHTWEGTEATSRGWRGLLDISEPCLKLSKMRKAKIFCTEHENPREFSLGLVSHTPTWCLKLSCFCFGSQQTVMQSFLCLTIYLRFLMLIACPVLVNFLSFRIRFDHFPHSILLLYIKLVWLCDTFLSITLTTYNILASKIIGTTPLLLPLLSQLLLGVPVIPI